MSDGSHALKETLGNLPPDCVTALCYADRNFKGKSRPVLVSCSDGHKYVIKGPIKEDDRSGRDATNHHIVGRLGNELFPDVVPPVTIVSMHERLTTGTRELNHILSGLCHGSLFKSGCLDSDSNGFDNRSRFAKIALLYALCGIEDRQYIYDGEGLVYSVDNGNAFAKKEGFPNWNGSTWDAGTLNGDRRDPGESLKDFGGLGLTDDNFREAAHALETIEEDRICRCVASAPSDWGVSLQDRTALVEWLSYRLNGLRDQFTSGTSR